MIWDGTRYNILFRKSNLIVIILIAAIDFGIYFWTLAISRDLFKKNVEEKNYSYLEELHLVWLYSLSMFGNCFIYLVFMQ